MKYTLTAFAALLCAAAAHAQQQQPADTPRPGQATQAQPGGAQPGTAQPGATANDYRRGSTFIGSGVMLNNQQMGKIVDYAINRNGQVQYVIVDHGGQYVAVPYGALQAGARGNSYSINIPNVTAEKLRGMTFERDRWPNFGDTTWSQKQRTLWGENAFRNDNRGGTGTNPGTRPGTGTNPGGATTPGGAVNPGRVNPAPPGGGTAPDRR